VATADEAATRIQAAGFPGVVVVAEQFWRDASLRFEHGREDVESYYQGWLDAESLRREVLDPLAESPGRFLPSLRDPATNRSTRADYQTLAAPAVVIVAGELLLGRGLPFDHTIHLAVSPAARRRRTATDRQWTLPALDRYDAEVVPADIADVLVTWNDPQRPAVRT
jgi:hypothetical protein